MSAISREELEAKRFWKHVEITDTCWIWNGTRNKRGYGRFFMWSKKSKRRSIVAHRWSYTKLVGPIPTGLELDHKCRNKACINPEHLEPVTPEENKLRARKTHCKHGHPFEGSNLYVKPDGERTCQTCARQWRRKYNAKIRDKIKTIREQKRIASSVTLPADVQGDSSLRAL